MNQLSLLVIQVQVHVKPEVVDTVCEATVKNTRESLKEPGVARFDVLQDSEDPTRFVLLEVYRTNEAPVARQRC